MPQAAGTCLGPYKILPQEFAADTARRQRFESEARAVAALSHPKIVAIYDHWGPAERCWGWVCRCNRSSGNFNP